MSPGRRASRLRPGRGAAAAGREDVGHMRGTTPDVIDESLAGRGAQGYLDGRGGIEHNRRGSHLAGFTCFVQVHRDRLGPLGRLDLLGQQGRPGFGVEFADIGKNELITVLVVVLGHRRPRYAVRPSKRLRRLDDLFQEVW